MSASSLPPPEAAIRLAAILGRSTRGYVGPANWSISPFAKVSGNERYLRIPAEDRSPRERSLRIATVDLAVGMVISREVHDALDVRALLLSVRPPHLHLTRLTSAKSAPAIGG
jgi:hypothetical protein